MPIELELRCHGTSLADVKGIVVENTHLQDKVIGLGFAADRVVVADKGDFQSNFARAALQIQT